MKSSGDAPRMIRVASTREIPAGKSLVRMVNGQEVAIFHAGDSFYAVLNICPHQHSPLLAEGELEDTIITCPMHGWSWDLVTGQSVRASGRLTKYALVVNGEDILVEEPREEELPPW